MDTIHAENADIQTLIQHVVDEFVVQTAGAVPRDHLMSVARRVLPDGRATTARPVLVSRMANAHVRAELIKEGSLTTTKPEVLVLGDDSGSQAAAALLRHYARGRLHVVCAGLHPVGYIHPEVSGMLLDRGIRVTDAPMRCSTAMLEVADHLIVIGDPPGGVPQVDGQDRQYWAVPRITSGSTWPDLQPVLADIDARVRARLRSWLPGADLGGPVMSPSPATA
jgi:hypothetical protein